MYMRENEVAVFNIIKASLWSKECGKLVFSNEIIEELRQQSVDGIAVSVHPDSANEKYFRAAKFAQMLAVQTGVINCIQEAGVPVAIIKGTAAGIYYPNPYLRRYGDIDVLVHPDNYYKAIETLKNHGYLQLGHPGEDVTSFTKQGYQIELHQRPPGLNRVKEGVYIHSFILSGLDSIEVALINQPTVAFPMLPWKQNGLELIWHIREHLYNGLGLRQIIDWMMFVHRYLLLEDRYRDYSDILKQAGLEKLAMTVTRMCQLFLGLNNDISWCKSVDDELCVELMEYIVDQGNFGIKKEDDKTVKALTRYRNPFSFLAAMHRKGMREWKLANEYVVFRPFAWAHTCFWGMKQYIGQGVKNKLLLDLAENKRRQKLFDKLYDGELDGKVTTSFHK